MSGKVLIIGLGDIGCRIASSLLGRPDVDELVLAGRHVHAKVVSKLMTAEHDTRIRIHQVDASKPSSVERLFRVERPDLVVQCASLISPWYFSQHPTQLGDALRAAGFAAQLSAQLPLVTSVMEAARTVDFRSPVVNCSYPDVTHPVLARIGLAPTVGIGNVGMILAKVQLELRQRAAPDDSGDRGQDSICQLVRILAHHSHVTPAMLSRREDKTDCHPLVFVGERGTRADELVYSGPAFASDPRLNTLSAATALPVICALLPSGGSLRTSVPGPLGLPGGFPVRLSNETVQLDLPSSITLSEALQFQRQSALIDGLEDIDEDGTVIYTEQARQAVQRLAPELCEPLKPADAMSRFRYLLSLL